VTEGVLDTSTFLLLDRMTVTALLPDPPWITTVTLAELGVGPLVARSEDERVRRSSNCRSRSPASIHCPSTLRRLGP